MNQRERLKQYDSYLAILIPAFIIFSFILTIYAVFGTAGSNLGVPCYVALLLTVGLAGSRSFGASRTLFAWTSSVIAVFVAMSLYELLNFYPQPSVITISALPKPQRFAATMYVLNHLAVIGLYIASIWYITLRSSVLSSVREEDPLGILNDIELEEQEDREEEEREKNDAYKGAKDACRESFVSQLKDCYGDKLDPMRMEAAFNTHWRLIRDAFCEQARKEGLL